MTETPQELALRWRNRAADMENGDGASRLAAYHLRFAADELDTIIKPIAAAMLVDAFADDESDC